jgi:hypothetical protein
LQYKNVHKQNTKDDFNGSLKHVGGKSKSKTGSAGNDEELCLTSLYSVQLVNVLLNKGELEAEEDVVQTVRAMMTWRPERIVNFLLIAPEAEYNPSGWEKAKDHRELARIVLADIEEKMIRHFPWYRSGEE